VAIVARPRGAKARAAAAVELLREQYPDARTALNHANAYQLLVATILSAQTTDERVNMVTPTLFAKYPTPADLASADTAEL
jgi:endonuclease-3